MSEFPPIYTRHDYKSLNNMFEILIKKYKKARLNCIGEINVIELDIEIKRTRKKFKTKLRKVCYRN